MKNTKEKKIKRECGSIKPGIRYSDKMKGFDFYLLSEFPLSTVSSHLPITQETAAN